MNVFKLLTIITYLSVNFSANGSFTNHKEKLIEKTRRSVFATRLYRDFLRLPININKKFLMLYFSPYERIVRKCGVFMINVITTAGVKDMIEKTHIFFCKMCLGVNKRSPNAASRNELGRLPLKLQISLNILKFWIQLENQPTDRIAKLCFNHF